MNRPKLLYFVTEDWYFCSHRLPLALAAQDAGYDVAVVTHVNEHGEIIRQAGIRLIPFNLSRRGMNLVSELAMFGQLIKLYNNERPDLVHHVAMKPVLYGSLAARLAGVPRVVNALAGLGYIFTSDQWRARFLRPFIRNAFRGLLNSSRSRLILQNDDDRAMFIDKGIILSDERIRLIRGSGVDSAVFLPMPETKGIPLVMLASRMLWDKGIKEFVEAAKQIRDRGIEVRFVLVGDTDPHNPSAIPNEQLIAWHKEGVIEWWGRHDDMPSVFEQSHIVCLPSYREGLPKVLLEAASCSRPIVTTDTPGCREVVRHEENGLLVPVRSTIALTNALQLLIENPELRKKMGAKGREIAVSKFAVEKIVAETLAVYRELIG
ncbi:MAG: N,N'-diacetylbacillosaminyl-diphospho-undecaprenol alpha-1,3-N-acetylgalactosaminyltransferase [Syntrophus sp. PtaB.Bin001]|nr:MAG: N,N'-diacetylbacillosaminyl-diphospho-undecaprenol alpha-1,3-N-acetylgalactosaminyltransferase [Syntrophus sp. PtaB.Bin001]